MLKKFIYLFLIAFIASCKKDSTLTPLPETPIEQQFILINSSNSPLPSNVINSITKDASNCFWIATNNGICKYNNGN